MDIILSFCHMKVAKSASSFVENSIKHGIRRIQKNGYVNIRIFHSEGSLCIQVKDNGPGLSPIPNRTIQSTGKGLLIVDDLIRLFNKLEGTKISYTLTNVAENSNQKGTEALIMIRD